MPIWTWSLVDANALQMAGPTVDAFVGPASLAILTKGERVLLDTGAAITCISPSLRRELALLPDPVRTVTLIGSDGKPAGGPAYELGIEFASNRERRFTTFVGEKPDLDADSHAPYRIVLGRELLRYCVLVYNGPKGDVTLAV